MANLQKLVAKEKQIKQLIKEEKQRKLSGVFNSIFKGLNTEKVLEYLETEEGKIFLKKVNQSIADKIK